MKIEVSCPRCNCSVTLIDIEVNENKTITINGYCDLCGNLVEKKIFYEEFIRLSQT